MDLLSFFGRFHPLILHLPIGFLILGYLMEWVDRRQSPRNMEKAVGYAVKLGMWSAIVAAVSGYLLSLDGGYQEQLLSRHQWLGIGTALLAIVLQVMFRRKSTHAGAQRYFFPIYTLTVIILTITGHVGGSLTHGSGFLTEPLSPKAERAPITDLESAQVFGDFVQPIIDSKCKSCHNPSKLKGDLLLSSVEGIKNGGSTGPLFVAGDPENSLMIQRIHLPMEDEDHMPPEGKRQLSEDEKSLLEWWIAAEAPFEASVAESNVPDNIRTILEKQVEPEQGIFALDIPSAKQGQLDKLQQAGLMVNRVAQAKPYLEVNLSGKELDGGALKELQSISKQLISLDLSNSNLNDEMMEALRGFPHLTKLFLQNTQISDEGLENIKDLEYLEYLNLYNTQVSDAGIAQLSELKSLKHLFLWQTAASEQGVAQLEAKLPALSVNIGADRSVFDSLEVEAPPQNLGTE